MRFNNSVFTNDDLIFRFFVSSKQQFKGKTGIVTKNESLFNLFKLATLFIARQGLKCDIFHDPEAALVWIADPDTPKEH